jgi:hypothetical protein
MNRFAFCNNTVLIIISLNILKKYNKYNNKTSNVKKFQILRNIVFNNNKIIKIVNFCLNIQFC